MRRLEKSRLRRHEHPGLVLSTAILTLLFLALSSVAHAQSESEQPETPAEEFFAVFDVNIVNIDVWVNDKSGNPTADMGVDDFEVYRDGKPVKITNFYAVADGRRNIAPAAAEAALEPTVEGADDELLSAPPDLSEPAPPETDPEHRLWMIVYIDNYNIDPIERNRVLPAVQQFLMRNIRGDDQAMVVGYNRSLEVLQPFTNDTSLLASAVEQFRSHAGQAPIRQRELLQTLQRIDDADSSGQAMLYARLYADEQLNSISFTTDALERLLETLGGLPGRKALVHVSSGVPMNAGEAAFQAVATKFGASEAFSEIPRHSTARDFERIDRQANAHRVAFYTVDAGGLRGLQFGNAEFGGFVNPKMRRMLDSVVHENLQSPLRLMALETGGRAILNVNRILPALEKAALDFRTFYSLGISASGEKSGSYHKIKVKLRGPHKGLQLRYRGGYRSKDAETRVREQLLSALLYAHEDNPLAVEVDWGRPAPYGKEGNYILPIQLKVPLHDTVLLPTRPGKHEARLQLYVAAVGEDGTPSAIDTVPFGVRLADENVAAALGESLVHTHKLLISPGRKKVGIAVLDLFGQQASVITGFLDIGPRGKPSG